MYEMVSGSIWGMAQKGADKASGPQFTVEIVRYVDESLASKDTEMGNVRFVTAPCLFRSHVLEGMGRRHVV